jgi:hypothetical protein
LPALADFNAVVLLGERFYPTFLIVADFSAACPFEFDI